MRKIYWLLMIGSLLMLILTPGIASVTAAIDRPPHDEVPPVPLIARLRAAAPGNLLVNGSMDDLPFYWMPPNHYVAGGWGRWWIHLTVLPEYDDTRGIRPHYDGDRAQVYFKWFGPGEQYHAGIYQMVNEVVPCMPYRFTMWARNHTLEMVKPHARIGLDPLGTQLTSGPEEGAVLALPRTTVWSREQINLFVWEQLAVQATPVGNRLTAITYAYPELPASGGPDSYYADTYWDAGRVEEVGFPSGQLPPPASNEASDFISGVETDVVQGNVVVDWELAAPALTQVGYRVVPKIDVKPPETIFIEHQVYLPLIHRSLNYMAYTQTTPLSSDVRKFNHVVISDLQEGDTVIGVILVRRAVAGVCATEVSAPFKVTVE